MITVSTDFATKSISNFRRPKVEVHFDWTRQGSYQNETDYVYMVEVERKLSEPLGGVSIAQADIRLVNSQNRYTPRSS